MENGESTNQENIRIKKNKSSKKLLLLLILVLIGMSVNFIDYSKVFYNIFKEKPILEFTKPIKVTSKDNIVKDINNFIEKRKELIEKSYSKFEEYIIKLSNKEEISTVYFDYGHLIFLELQNETSTSNLVEKFMDNNLNSIYIPEDEKYKIEDKIDEIEDNYKKFKKYIKNKYNDISLDKNLDISVTKLLKYYTTTKTISDFLINNLTQNDIDKFIKRIKIKLTTKTTSYNNDFPPQIEYWNSLINKNHYDKTMKNYYFMDNLDLSENKKYKLISKDVNEVFLEDIITQYLTSIRVGYIYTKFKVTGVNEYLFDNGVFEILEKFINNTLSKEKRITTQKKVEFYKLESSTEKNKYMTKLDNFDLPSNIKLVQTIKSSDEKIQVNLYSGDKKLEEGYLPNKFMEINNYNNKYWIIDNSDISTISNLKLLDNKKLLFQKTSNTTENNYVLNIESSLLNSLGSGKIEYLNKGKYKGMFLISDRKHYLVEGGTLWTDEIVDSNAELIYIKSKEKNVWGCLKLNTFLPTNIKYPKLEQSLNDCVYVYR